MEETIPPRSKNIIKAIFTWIGIVLSVVIGFIQILQFYNSYTTKFDVKVQEVYGYKLPNKVSEEVLNNPKLLEVKQLIKSHFDSSQEKCKVFCRESINCIDSYSGRSLFPTYFQFYSIIDVVNTSNLKVESVTWNLEDEVYYQYNIGDSLVAGYSKSKVELGDLLPEQSIRLYAWSPYFKKYSFVSESGKASVIVGKTVYGFWASVGSFFNVVGYFWFFLMLMPITALYIYEKFRK